ncbi:MAG: T9SS type A sorting domain-containing protein [Bacteroidetes bacterium]|nr:MAG: T9SS type A sorting domain-containing protein [Bacteroidota bacterium]
MWTKQYGKATEDAGNAVIQTADGGYIIAGDIHINPNSGNHNACLLKTDASGNLQWVKTYGSNPGTEIAWDVRQTKDNGFLFAGATGFYGNGGAGDIFVVKTGNSGDVLWSKAYGGTAFDDFWYFQKTPDEGSMMVGLSYEGGQNILVVRTDSMGNSICNSTTVTPDVNTPILQVRSRTTVISAGTPNTPATLTYSTTVISNDLCDHVSVPETENRVLEISIWPNPFSSSAILSLKNPLVQNLDLEICDLMGNCIYKQVLNVKNSIIYLNVAPGIYFYKIIDYQVVIKTGKIMRI